MLQILRMETINHVADPKDGAHEDKKVDEVKPSVQQSDFKPETKMDLRTDT